MIVVTTDSIHNMRIVRTLGLVRGTSVRGRHLGKDIIASMRNAVGGEITEYTKILSETREQALDRMVEEAETLGANAIIVIRFSSSEIATNAAEVLAYGTAVVVEDATPPA
ncbi:MAG: YbjQ family protein [bacterium]|nr:YbjQ family protein [bacterium]